MKSEPFFINSSHHKAPRLRLAKTDDCLNAVTLGTVAGKLRAIAHVHLWLSMGACLLLSACQGVTQNVQQVVDVKTTASQIGGGPVKGDQVNIGGKGIQLTIAAEKLEDLEINSAGKQIRLTFAVANRFDEPLRLVRNGRSTEAIKAFQSMQQAQPEDVYTLLNLANSHLIAKQYAEAVARYSQVISHQKDLPAAYHNRGMAYYQQGLKTEAFADYQTALRLQPQYTAALHNRGALYVDRGEVDLGLADYSRAIALDPTQALTYSNRGETYARLKKWPEALSDYDKALTLNNQLAVVYFNRGSLYEQQKSIELALEDYNQAIRLDSTLSQAYNNRGLIQSQKLLFTEAIADFKLALATESRNPKIWYNLGSAQLNSGEFKDAISSLTQALALDPAYAAAYSQRGYCYSQLQQSAEAQKDYLMACQWGDKLACGKTP